MPDLCNSAHRRKTNRAQRSTPAVDVIEKESLVVVVSEEEDR